MCPGPPVFVSQTPRNRRHAYACTEPTRRPLRTGTCGPHHRPGSKTDPSWPGQHPARISHQNGEADCPGDLFSFFNIIFYIIAGFLIAVGSFGELIFLLVVAANTAIGIIQELHAKKKLDSLSLLSAPRSQVVRDGIEGTIPTSHLVQDDLVILSAGNQIPARCQSGLRQCPGERVPDHR